MKIELTLFFFFFSSIIINSGYVPLSDDLLFAAKRAEFYQRAHKQEFSVELLKECIYYEKIEHPDIVLKQSFIETGNYTSELFLVANNLFGMRFPHYRTTTAIVEYEYHSKYLHWTDSVKDYKIWQEWWLGLGYRFDEYLVFLYYIGYAEDPLYVLKIAV